MTKLPYEIKVITIESDNPKLKEANREITCHSKTLDEANAKFFKFVSILKIEEGYIKNTNTNTIILNYKTN